MDATQELHQHLADPRLFFILSVAALAVIVWKREIFARNIVGYGLMAVLGVFFFFGLFDENLVLINRQARQRADRGVDLPGESSSPGTRCARPC